MLLRGGARISTLDLFGKNFCVLAAADGAGYCDAARDAAADLGLALDCLSRGWRAKMSAIPDGRFADAYGLSDSGAVIVRPDGFVAWRAKDARHASTATVSAVLRSLLCRNDQLQASVAAG